MLLQGNHDRVSKDHTKKGLKIQAFGAPNNVPGLFCHRRSEKLERINFGRGVHLEHLGLQHIQPIPVKYSPEGQSKG